LFNDAEQFALTTEDIAIGDERLGGGWGEGLTRLVFASRNPAQQDMWTLRVCPAEWVRARSFVTG
jgi:hypothetical protein